MVDTGSDEWDGDGGVLDQFHEKRLDQLAGQDYKKREKSNMAGWAKVKPPHKRFAHSLTQLDAHLIICFQGRAQDRSRQRRKADESMGIQPVWGSAIPFKLDFHLHMSDKDRPGVYEPWFRGLQHERGIFPGGTVDAATVQATPGQLRRQRSSHRPCRGSWGRCVNSTGPRQWRGFLGAERSGWETGLRPHR